MASTAPLRASDARFLAIPLMPLLTAWGLWTNPGYSAAISIMVAVLIALLDLAWPGAQRSPAPAAHAVPHPALQWLLRLYVPLQMGLIALGAWVAVQGSWGLVLGVAFTVGFVTGAQGITMAHELGHSRSKFDRALGWLLMCSVGYGHFMVEHYRGHHPRAATLDDPASARWGESLWRFLPRTLLGSWRSAWQLEALRIARFKLSWLRSPLLWSVAANALLVAVLLVLGSYTILFFWCFQAAYAVWLLESINYIEHYGLQRSSSATGQREAFGLQHAWNADHVLSNSLLANLQRHSDHHMHATKPWPTLAALPGPQLPTGYSGCIFLATVPPLWFAAMHPRLEKLSMLQKI